MTGAQAQALADKIRRESRLYPDVRPIGNGERVVVVDGFYLWNPEDWMQHKHQWSSSLYRVEIESEL